jgi:hypothetical protein
MQETIPSRRVINERGNEGTDRERTDRREDVCGSLEQSRDTAGLNKLEGCC